MQLMNGYHLFKSLIEYFILKCKKEISGESLHGATR